jgi:Undecaprenyl-phosphate glucose phosphotransferase
MMSLAYVEARPKKLERRKVAKFSTFIPDYHIYLGLLYVGDIVAISAISIGFHRILKDGHEIREGYLPLTLLTAFIAVNVLQASGAYSRHFMCSLGVQIRKCFIGAIATQLLMSALLYIFRRMDDFSSDWFLISFISLLLPTIILHILMSRLFSWHQRTGRFGKTIAILGIPSLAERVADQLRRDTPPGETRGLHIFVVEDGGNDANLIVAQSLTAFARTNPLDEIIVAIPFETDSLLVSLLRRLAELPVDIKLCPGLLDPEVPARLSNTLGPLPAITVFERPLKGSKYILKRSIDFCLSVFLLFLLAPLLLVVAILIKIDSPGPVLFSQERHGFNNQPIKVLKFRTMRHMPSATTLQQARRGDPRVTRIGRVLRRTSIDELPQLVNVLAGEMSLVGPRPHAVVHNEEYGRQIDFYFARHRVKPGITGWAQVNGLRGETDTLDKMRRRVTYDLTYIENWSLLLDLKIIWMTIWSVTSCKNAF